MFDRLMGGMEDNKDFNVFVDPNYKEINRENMKIENQVKSQMNRGLRKSGNDNDYYKGGCMNCGCSQPFGNMYGGAPFVGGSGEDRFSIARDIIKELVSSYNDVLDIDEQDDRFVLTKKEIDKVVTDGLKCKNEEMVQCIFESLYNLFVKKYDWDGFEYISNGLDAVEKEYLPRLEGMRIPKNKDKKIEQMPNKEKAIEKLVLLMISDYNGNIKDTGTEYYNVDEEKVKKIIKGASKFTNIKKIVEYVFTKLNENFTRIYQWDGFDYLDNYLDEYEKILSKDLMKGGRRKRKYNIKGGKRKLSEWNRAVQLAGSIEKAKKIYDKKSKKVYSDWKQRL